MVFTKKAKEHYDYFLKHDKNITVKINKILIDINKTPYEGIGKVEALKHKLSGWYSRRINKKHRLVYKVENKDIIILSCYGHYDNIE